VREEWEGRMRKEESRTNAAGDIDVIVDEESGTPSDKE